MAPFAFRVLCTIYIGISLLFQWLLSWLVQVIFIVFSYPFISVERRHDICGHIFRFISFVGMDVLNPFWKVTVRNKFPAIKKRADGSKPRVILMMNHLSDADPFLAIRSFLPRDGSWVAKDDLFQVPLGGWAMANADDLKVVFRNKKSGFATVKGTVGPMMEQAAAKLRRGRMLCIFPEGTRNTHPEGDLEPFRLGFFTLAIDHDATIVPLAMSGTEKMWPRGSAVMDKAEAFFTFGQPIQASDFTEPQELADHVYKVITDMRESHPDRIAFHAAKQKDAKKVE